MLTLSPALGLSVPLPSLRIFLSTPMLIAVAVKDLRVIEGVKVVRVKRVVGMRGGIDGWLCFRGRRELDSAAAVHVRYGFGCQGGELQLPRVMDMEGQFACFSSFFVLKP